MKYPNDEYAKTVCKIGQGAACCRYLALGGSGWSCEKLTANRHYLDKRVAEKSMNARGDNCEGLASR